MDSTLKDYMGMNPKEAMVKLQELKTHVMKVGGVFVPLWHNHTVSDYGEWKGWREVFESSLSNP